MCQMGRRSRRNLRSAVGALGAAAGRGPERRETETAGNVVSGRICAAPVHGPGQAQVRAVRPDPVPPWFSSLSAMDPPQIQPAGEGPVEGAEAAATLSAQVGNALMFAADRWCPQELTCRR
jgi:hypothetical protein